MSISFIDNADASLDCVQLQVRPNARTRFQLTVHQELHAKWGPYLPPGSIAVQVCLAQYEALPIWIPGSGMIVKMTPAHITAAKSRSSLRLLKTRVVQHTLVLLAAHSQYASLMIHFGALGSNVLYST